MKILVTGGCGFIGSNFILNQIEKNNYILNVDKLTYAANLDNLICLENNPLYSFINADILDKESLKKYLINFNPEIIINFAAETHVDRSIDDSSNFIETNISGVYELLSVSLEYFNNLSSNQRKKFRFIQISTDEVYGSVNNGSFTELSRYNPSSPYSASKAAADHLVMAWHKTFNFPAIITNCTNNYGPMQFPEKLIPLMTINCLNEKKLPIYGKGENIRNWLHVLDHCNALDKVIKKGAIGESYNIGSLHEISNLEVVNMICNILDKEFPSKNYSSYKELITFVKDRPGHDFRYSVNASKLIQDLNWRPKFSFEQGILNTVTWYLNNKIWWQKILNEKYNLDRLGELTK